MAKKSTQEIPQEAQSEDLENSATPENNNPEKNPTADEIIGDLQTQLAATKDQMLRVAAESENVRRRAAKEVEEANKYGVTNFARDLISILENLQRASETIPPEQKNLADGIELIKKELLSIFERRGIKRIEPQAGEKFDHNLHQAVAQIEDPKFQPGSIIQSMQAGYIIHERLLRPAIVTVAKSPAADPKMSTTA